MDDLKKYIGIISASIIAIVFVYVFYGLYVFIEVETKKSRFDKLAESWRKNRPKAYSYEVHEGCMFSRSYQVIHKDGEDMYFDIRSYCDYDGLPNCSEEKRNIFGVFDRLKEISGKAEMLDVKYNRLGYPEYVDIDWRRSAIDDECFINIKNFKKI